MRIWRRQDDLERELRAQRPEPRRDLLDGIASRIVGESRRRSDRRLRLGVAVALSVGMLAALGAFGGLTYAANGITHAVSSAVHVIAPAKPVKLVPASALSSAMAQYKVAVCFHGHTLAVDSHAVDALTSAGATLGACNGGSFKPDEKLIRMCFHGQNVSISDNALIAAKNRLSQVDLALAAAVRQHDIAKENQLVAQRQGAVRAYELELAKLTRLNLTAGFCKA